MLRGKAGAPDNYQCSCRSTALGYTRVTSFMDQLDGSILPILSILSDAMGYPAPSVMCPMNRSLPPKPEQSCHPSERRDAGFALLLGTGGARQLCLAFSHGLSSQIDLVSVVYQPIQDGVSQRRIADDRMPFIDGQLTGGHR